jgi:hypothetical protein
MSIRHGYFKNGTSVNWYLGTFKNDGKLKLLSRPLQNINKRVYLNNLVPVLNNRKRVAHNAKHVDMYLFTKSVVNHLKRMWNIVNEKKRRESNTIKARQAYKAAMTSVKTKTIKKKRVGQATQDLFKMWTNRK